MTWTWLALRRWAPCTASIPGWAGCSPSRSGCRKGRARAVWRALSPLALGHALAIGAAVARGGGARAAPAGRGAPVDRRRRAARRSATLRLLRHRHPRYGGMRVGFRELTVWSFLMATAHGAGLMVLPLLVGAADWLGVRGARDASWPRRSVLPLPGPGRPGLQATALHTAGYLLVTGLVAVVVYRKLGLRMLRTMWINLDLIWGGALVVTGVLTIAL